MKQFGSKTQKTGLFGEDIAVTFLKNKGFSIIERNYTKRIGEIDVIAKKNEILYFIEVKSLIRDVSRETYSPFENFTKHKMRKFSRTAEFYLIEKSVSRETLWQIAVISVLVTRETRSAKIDVLWNVTLS